MLNINSLHFKPENSNSFQRTICDKIFCSKNGFENSYEWHKSTEAINEYKNIVNERAILIQSLENYNELSKKMPKYLDKSIPTFGENIIVNGLQNSEICIGDIFKVKGQHSNLLIEVSSPRKPCYKIDKIHKSPYGLKGLKRFSLTNGLAGWFCRVLHDGYITNSDILVRISNPYPKWNLVKISKCLYGSGDYKIQAGCNANWNESKELLRELMDILPLAYCEWKEELYNLYKNI